MRTAISSIRLILYNCFIIIAFNHFLGKSFIISSQLSLNTHTTFICLIALILLYYFIIKRYNPNQISFWAIVKSISIKLLSLTILIVWEFVLSLYMFSGHIIPVSTTIFLFLILIAIIVINIYIINKFPFP
jgi:hypothetical protein